jgi:hypothetical protein
MKTNKFDQIVLDENDLCDLVMQGRDINSVKRVVVDPSLDLEKLVMSVERPESLLTWSFPYDRDTSVPEFDLAQQSNWYMPPEYKNIDIAEYVLSLCHTQQELQRVGQELLMFQERNLFDLLRYLKYLVDRLAENNVIWGVGRGSSVASYVLYLLKIHRVDSIFYDLDPREFLR